MKKCHSDKNFAGFESFRSAFSLVETAAALLILAIICSGVVIVFDNSVNSAANSALRMQAFEVAEENMEKLLASSSVSENVEYGHSERYPAIEWQTTVETFYEPTTSRLWTRAVCSADFLDISGKQQKVELTNWLTDLTQQQVIDLMKIKEQSSDPNAVQQGGSDVGPCGMSWDKLNQMTPEEFDAWSKTCPEMAL
jgi:Tfp pilus assembly protein PilV